MPKSLYKIIIPKPPWELDIIVIGDSQFINLYS